MTEKSTFEKRPLLCTLQGERVLLEFQISEIGIAAPQHVNAVNDQNKSYVAIEIEFHRELGNMVNTYFQTFLLCLLAYLTLYINLTDFGNRCVWASNACSVLTGATFFTSS